ncbi:MAG TPA: EpsD family peptidyl-prolyl cis-trans isomerase [Burkholderiales bacterium]|nr:EpsD family peptidyl-prolyl cis-trans isomerase [Burkholderiales bacterium]
MRPLGGFIVLAGLAACGPVPQGHDGVVARVNGEEITLRQLEDELAVPGAGESAPGRHRPLERLVEQRLLAQQAVASGLDRDAAVSRILERTRREVLAQLALDRLVGDVRPGAKQVRAYYAEHADLFAGRRIYTFRRFVLEQGLAAPVKARLDAAKGADEVTAILSSAGVAYSRMTDVRPAETLPAKLLAEASAMSAGDVLLFNDGSRVVLMQLVATTAEPVRLEAALPSIRARLAQAMRRQKAEQVVGELRRKAHIEYFQRKADVQSTAMADEGAIGAAAAGPLQSPRTALAR